MTRVTAALAAIQLCVAASAAAQSDQTFRISPMVGDVTTGSLQSISPSGEVVLRGHATVGLADLIELKRVGDAEPSKSTMPAVIHLRSGNVLPCTIRRGHGPQIEVETRFGRDGVRFNVSNLAAIRFSHPLDEDGGFARAIDKPSSTKDLVFAWDRAGEAIKRYSLRVVAVDGRDAVIDAGGKQRKLPLSRVYGIVFGADNGAPPDAPPHPIATLHGGFGTPLWGTLRGWDGLNCSLVLPEGATLDVPCAQVARIAIDSGRIAFLSDLEPKQVRQVAALNQPKPWLRNRTPGGVGIELGGTKFDRGLCLVPRTTLDYELTGEFDVFEATIGIDDSSSRLANAVIRVVADKKIVFDSGTVVLGAAPSSVSIDLTGVKQLTLETDFGENLDLGDHCVFANARFRKN